MGQAIGLAVQLAISQLLLAKFHRHRFGGFPGAVGHQLVNQTLGRETCVALVPPLKDLLPFGVVQQVQLAESLPWVGNHALQQVLPVSRHALHGTGLKQVLGIAERGPDTFGGFLDIQVQVEMRRLAFPFQPLYRKIRQLLLNLSLAHVGLVVEHHLEQRVVAQAALGLQRFHQLFEGQVLVSLGVQRPLPGLLQQLLDAHLPVEIGLEHLGVDEEADQTLGLAAIAVGDRYPDTDLFLATVAMQQGLERGQ
ncbi:hypothetical protein PS706_05902 [Pseudomonas fluorescens]|nr:hypothetical protein PS706_05902 [Pseudomonas fluorescens]